jgi:hypothetical protein
MARAMSPSSGSGDLPTRVITRVGELQQLPPCANDARYGRPSKSLPPPSRPADEGALRYRPDLLSTLEYQV